MGGPIEPPRPEDLGRDLASLKFSAERWPQNVFTEYKALDYVSGPAYDANVSSVLIFGVRLHLRACSHARLGVRCIGRSAEGGVQAKGLDRVGSPPGKCRRAGRVVRRMFARKDLCSNPIHFYG